MVYYTLDGKWLYKGVKLDLPWIYPNFTTTDLETITLTGQVDALW